MSDSEQLERETQSCRDQLADTVDELRARMTPGEVVDQLVDYAQDTTGGLFFHHLKQQVGNNPLPVAVMAAGFAWLMLGKGVSASRLRQSTASVGDKGHRWLSDDAERVAASRETADRLSEAGSRAGDVADSGPLTLVNGFRREQLPSAAPPPMPSRRRRRRSAMPPPK
jgi:hypothetical protein